MAPTKHQAVRKDSRAPNVSRPPKKHRRLVTATNDAQNDSNYSAEKQQRQTLSSEGSTKKKQRVSSEACCKEQDAQFSCMSDVEDPETSSPLASTASPEDVSVSQKRKALKFQKLMQRNPAAEFVAECNALYARLIDSKQCSLEDKHAKVQECLDFIDGFDVTSTDAFVGKARLLSVSRCLQMCYKYGSDEHRKFMTERLKPHFVKLALTDTATFLCSKMLKYSDPDTQISLATLLVSQPTTAVAFTKCGSKVIAYALSLPKPFPADTILQKLVLRLCIPKVITLQVPDLEGKMPYQIYSAVDARGKEQIKEHLDSVITRCVDKELVDRPYFHHVFELYAKICTQDELISFANTLTDCLLLLLASRPGCWTICRLLDVMDAKGRKKFIYSWKPANISPADVALNDVSSIVLLKLFATVDDTKLLKETLLGPATGFEFKGSDHIKAGRHGTTQLLALCRSRVGRKSLLLILADNASPYLTKGEKLIVLAKSPMSKKDTETRRRELLLPLLGALKALMDTLTRTDLVHIWMQEQGCRDVLVEYMRNSKDTTVVDLLLESLKTPTAVESVFDHQTAQRTLIQLLRIGSSVRPTAPNGLSEQVHVPASELLKASDGQTLAQHLWKLLESSVTLANILRTRGVFVIIDLIAVIRIASLQPLDELKRFSTRCSSIVAQEPTKEAPGIKLLNSRLAEIAAH